MATRALVLFAHGARAQSWAEPFERLRALTAARLPDCDVSLAFLELMAPRLPDEVAALAARGVLDVTVVPVFFGMGGHLRRDLPQIVDELRARFPQLSIKVAGPVGEDPGVLAAMADYCIASLS
ncbi:MAG TPA: CbiX/SirB N-terminal domain-containing protein [Telluria sp.]|nr:CbiX/SirB N-terminal domain-containing protein [Telluria sp.]